MKSPWWDWRLLVIPVFVLAYGYAMGCTAKSCPPVEMQPEGNAADGDREALEDCEEDEEDKDGAPAGIGGAPSVKTQDCVGNFITVGGNDNGQP